MKVVAVIVECRVLLTPYPICPVERGAPRAVSWQVGFLPFQTALSLVSCSHNGFSFVYCWGHLA